jgi:hypothetical protein
MVTTCREAWLAQQHVHLALLCKATHPVCGWQCPELRPSVEVATGNVRRVLT